ncbi:phosphate ABC transporter substrate-binding protein [Thiohalobacter sp. IOR34]|uniref:phosphate ABC transporter substrate-binding protein n=1 Tax=Thiohalobacter sp. IOR34 TaxID=3057176 RepID=UPI0025B08C17|nr:phosphate ABC transporter substrate-binding protein [Thiohalobacter sp. IOR34]WJW74742.1 phosphate ABC transporter substrate-binding protein [Thiohalobacter sp. IOR34]
MATLLGLATSVAQAELAVITNPDNPEAGLTKKQVKLIYLGKKKTFPGGMAVKPVDQKEESPVHAEFYDKVVGKRGAKLKSYWSKMVFSGKASPPQVIGNDAEVKAWVSRHKDALGYIDASQADGSVKVLLTIP